MDNIVCGSPYGLKVQTYLRMAGIPYKVKENYNYLILVIIDKLFILQIPE